MLEFLRKIKKRLSGGVVHLSPHGERQGNVLLSYTTLPFISPGLIDAHTNRWECRRIAEIFLDRGYAVDLVDFDNKIFSPQKRYDYCIDIQNNLEKFLPHLNRDCVKIFHATTAYWSFNNMAEERRLLDIKKRHGFEFAPQRTLPPSRNAEIADYITILGNDFTVKTYSHITKQIHQIPISTTHLYPSPEHKDFNVAKNGFIWVGGTGMAHKGLDLVLEAFAIMPELRLTIFGKPDKDFVRAYHQELYTLPNIHYGGYVDFGGNDFKDAIYNSVALIFPSCSEGSSGGVVTAMHAGLIPIVSRESGVTVGNAGVILKENTIEIIRHEARRLASLSIELLQMRSVQIWNHARKQYTRDTFSRAYEMFVDRITKNNTQKQ